MLLNVRALKPNPANLRPPTPSHQLISRNRHYSNSPHTSHTMPPPRLSPALLRTRPQSQLQCLRRTHLAARYASFQSQQPSQSDQPAVPWKTPGSIEQWPPAYMIPPPKDGEILYERKPNRALPPYVQMRSTKTHTTS